MPSSVCIGVDSPADVVSWDPARCLRLPHLIALDQDSTEDLDDLGHGDDLARRGAKPKTFRVATFYAKKFPDEVRGTDSQGKPKKLAFSSHDIAKEFVMNVLAPPHYPLNQQSANFTQQG